MQLRPPIVFTLFRTELRMLLRDRRVLVTSVVLPMLLTPLLLLGSKASVSHWEKNLREMTYRYAVTGPKAESVRELMRAAAARVESKSKTNSSGFHFAEEKCDNANEALTKGSIHFILKGLGASRQRLTNSSPATARAERIRFDDAGRENARGRSLGGRNGVPGRPRRFG